LPDWVLVPVGGGATLHGIWQGFRDIVRLGLAARPPRLASVQPETFDTLRRAMARGLRTQEELASVTCDETVETTSRNLKHGVPPDGDAALAALYGSDGVALAVSDEAAIDAQLRLGRAEGIFCEPSSAVVLPAAELLVREGWIAPGATIVAIVTGSGFREQPRQPDDISLRLPRGCSAAEFEHLVGQRFNVAATFSR
jgi:threonine synthase